ncbi:hypothetical protein BKA63DRAFT_565975 [Paraphoma chrysanthemicola]|nr:hypothetical protein BKA63DRAFT_565975 [Paraphoma chrysanthemicola]
MIFRLPSLETLLTTPERRPRSFEELSSPIELHVEEKIAGECKRPFEFFEAVDERYITEFGEQLDLKYVPSGPGALRLLPVCTTNDQDDARFAAVREAPARQRKARKFTYPHAKQNHIINGTVEHNMLELLCAFPALDFSTLNSTRSLVFASSSTSRPTAATELVSPPRQIPLIATPVTAETGRCSVEIEVEQADWNAMMTQRRRTRGETVSDGVVGGSEGGEKKEEIKTPRKGRENMSVGKTSKEPRTLDVTKKGPLYPAKVPIEFAREVFVIFKAMMMMEGPTNCEKSPRSDEDVQAVIEERTQHCINLINGPKIDNTSKDVIIFMGRPGTGKSSAVEMLSGTRGHAKGGIETDGHQIFVMDTPGFSTGGEAETLEEIKRGIESIRSYARFVGVLYFSKIGDRIEVLDERLRASVLAFCGPSSVRLITFVTTFWTPLTDVHGMELNENLKQLKQGLLTDFVDNGAKFYEHGREFPNANGAGKFFNWHTADGKQEMSNNAKRMISSRYIKVSNVPKLRFVQELEDGASALETEAARALGLYSDPIQTSKEPTPVSDPKLMAGHTGSPVPPPDPVGGTSCCSTRNQSCTSSHFQAPEATKDECIDESKDKSKAESKTESKDGNKNATNKESEKDKKTANTDGDGGNKNNGPPWWQVVLNTSVDLTAKIVTHFINNSLNGTSHGNFSGPPRSSNAGFSWGGFTGDLGSATDHDKFWGGDGTTQSRAQRAKMWGFDPPGSAGDAAWNTAFCNESKRRFSAR